MILSAVSATAAQTNLLSNPVLQPGSVPGTLPNGWAHQGWVPDGSINHMMGTCPDIYLCSTYSYGIDSVDGQPYMDVLIQNTSTIFAYTNLFMNTPVAVSSGDNYRIAMSARVITRSGNPNVAIGFHLFDVAGYISEIVTNVLLIDVADQIISHHYQTVPYGTTGRTPTAIQPRLSVYLAPGEFIQIRIKVPQLTKGVGIASIGVDGQTGQVRTLDAAPGKVLVFTAGLQGRPLATAQAYVSLIPSQPDQPILSFNHLLSSSDPNVGDVWQITLPPNTLLMNYAISYSLQDLATNQFIPLNTTPEVITINTATGTVYQIGSVNVSYTAGMSIGQHFHGHPGRIGGNSRGIDPILVPYHFVRSHDSENVVGTSWWVEDTVTHNPDGLFDWTEFDRWANFHAQPGQKKLLITFYGSPTWASSKPTEPSPYGILGLSAPPANIASYQRMVSATVQKYKDRIFGVECWNEPGKNGSGFFTGTGTQLADVCKAIYVATKAVDNTIPTICPAEGDLTWLLSQKTSQGEPIHQFCDWVGAHPYDHTGTDLKGASYSLGKLGDFVERLELMLRGLGIIKPIAITEWGMNCMYQSSPTYPTLFHDMTSQARADVLYQTLAKAKEKGVVALGLYSYDSGDLSATCKYGFEGISSGNSTVGYSYDAVTALGVTRAVMDFGRPLP